MYSDYIVDISYCFDEAIAQTSEHRKEHKGTIKM